MKICHTGTCQAEGSLTSLLKAEYLLFKGYLPFKAFICKSYALLYFFLPFHPTKKEEKFTASMNSPSYNLHWEMGLKRLTLGSAQWGQALTGHLIHTGIPSCPTHTLCGEKWNLDHQSLGTLGCQSWADSNIPRSQWSRVKHCKSKPLAKPSPSSDIPEQGCWR